ncbi:MAG TPA: hypothetical protein VF719_00455, partial [Abditibacteriaceae bacterium]
KLNTTVAKLIPGLGDKISLAQENRQQYDEAPRNSDGALHQASEVATPVETGHTHGSGPSNVEE